MKCPHGSLSPDQRLEILKRLVKEKPITKLAEELRIGRASIYRYLKGEREIPPSLDPRLCESLSEEDLLALLNNKQLLESVGIIKNGQVNAPLLLAIVNTGLEYEATKELILKHIARHYKTELQDLLSTTLPRVELRWSSDFEKYLTEKKSNPITERTLKDYRSVWLNCLEGKTFSWHLIKQLEGKHMKCRDGRYHPTNWPRQIFRHYISYLYSIGKLDGDSYSRLRIVVPGRKYGRKVNQKVIEKEDIIRTLGILREERKDIYTLYLFILFSATRFEHALKIMAEWNPNEKLYVTFLNRTIRRLECFQVHCRYYAGILNSKKRTIFAYFPKPLLPMIEKWRRELPGKRRVERAVKKRGGVMPSIVRTFAMREMKTVIRDEDTYKFIISKISELTVSARHYLDLLGEADKLYPNYIQHITEVMEEPFNYLKLENP